ncbi:MAG: glycosyltransferase, partial [Gammaproteobacteria bacterium]
MNGPIVTIVVTQRERFSYTATSLESIYKNTALPFKLIYLDGASPPHIKHYLATQAVEKGFTLIRAEHFIPSSKARNLGQAQVKTKYAVFIDNDVSVTPGWLEALVKCAEETEAWVVGPLCIEGKAEDQIIHTVGEEAHFKINNGQRTFHGPQRFT